MLSITQIVGGDTYNIIPEYVTLKGTVRALDEYTRLKVKQRLCECVETLPTLYGVKGSIDYQERYPATINNAACAAHVRDVARAVFGANKAVENIPPTMASEDFSFMLNAKKVLIFGWVLMSQTSLLLLCITLIMILMIMRWVLAYSYG